MLPWHELLLLLKETLFFPLGIITKEHNFCRKKIPLGYTLTQGLVQAIPELVTQE